MIIARNLEDGKTLIETADIRRLNSRRRQYLETTDTRLQGVQDKYLALSLWSFGVIERHYCHRRRVKVTILHWLECDDRVEHSTANRLQRLRAKHIVRRRKPPAKILTSQPCTN